MAARLGPGVTHAAPAGAVDILQREGFDERIFEVHARLLPWGLFASKH